MNYIEFSQENIKIGYIVDLHRRGKCRVRVTGTGKESISYEIVEGAGSGILGKASYSEIQSIVSEEIKIESYYPFQVGEVYTVKSWNGNEYVDKDYTIVKVTKKSVILKSGTDKPIIRKPRKIRDRSSESNYSWIINITNDAHGMHGTIYKHAETKN